MILFPAVEMEIKTPHSAAETEEVLRSNTGIKQPKMYCGRIKRDGFVLGCARYLKVPVSRLHGTIETQESGLNLKVSIRPTLGQFVFPLIFMALAFSRIAEDFSQFIQIMSISVGIFVLLVINYRASVKKDIDFINGLFPDRV